MDAPWLIEAMNFAADVRGGACLEAMAAVAVVVIAEVLDEMALGVDDNDDDVVVLLLL